MAKTIKEMTNKELIKLAKDLKIEIDAEASREEYERVLEEATAKTEAVVKDPASPKKNEGGTVAIRYPHMKFKSITVQGGLISFNADGFAFVPNNTSLHEEIAKIAAETRE